MSVVSASTIIGYDNIKLNENKKMTTLPYIEHPLKRIDDDDKSLLDIRGRSRNGQGNGQLIRSELSPIPSNHQHRRSSSSKFLSNSANYSQTLFDIPENENMNLGKSRDQVRLPIFGK